MSVNKQTSESWTSRDEVAFWKSRAISLQFENRMLHTLLKSVMKQTVVKDKESVSCYDVEKEVADVIPGNLSTSCSKVNKVESDVPENVASTEETQEFVTENFTADLVNETDHKDKIETGFTVEERHLLNIQDLTPIKSLTVDDILQRIYILTKFNQVSEDDNVDGTVELVSSNYKSDSVTRQEKILLLRQEFKPLKSLTLEDLLMRIRILKELCKEYNSN